MFLLALALGPLTAPPPSPDTPTIDLGSNAIRFHASADVIAYLVPESIPGESDLNGDGDRSDWVLHVADPRTGRSRNLRRAAKLPVQVLGPWVAFNVDEDDQAETDFNGDGDAEDGVAHLYDASTGRVVNLELANTSFDLGRKLLALSVFERDQGEVDLNGDGDANDAVLHVVELGDLEVRSFAIATGTQTFQVGGGFVAFLVPELAEGQTDLNGDGDAIDLVLHTLEVASGDITNLERAVVAYRGFDFDPPTLLLRADEGAQATDWNGDGDTLDDVLFAWSVPSGPLENLGLAAVYDYAQEGGRVALRVPEADQGNVDLNGDGDTDDDVLFAGLIAPNEPASLGIDAEDFAFAGASLVFRAREAGQGVDLNDDGDLLDRVVHVYRLRTGVTTNAGLAALGFLTGGRVAAVRVPEFFQGRGDLNGDGDAIDTVLHLLDVEDGGIVNLGLAVPGGFAAGEPDLELEPGRLAFNRCERGEDLDLNGDGDALDAIVHVLDLDDATWTSLELASSRSGIPPALVLRDGVLLFRVQEASQGMLDLNGDGDANDELLHVKLVPGPR